MSAKIKFRQFANRALRKFKRAAPILLTVASAGGVVYTTVSAVRATPKAIEHLKTAEAEKGESLTVIEKVKVAGPDYIPSVIGGTVAIGCMFGSTIISQKREASLISAYAMMRKGYRDYKGKVIELYGDDTHKEIMEAIRAEQCEDISIYAQGLITNTTTDFDASMEPDVVRTFYDSFSGRYFNTTTAKLIQAEYHLNRNFMFLGVVTLNDFYEFLGLSKTAHGDSVGWSSCNGDIYWIDFYHPKITLVDGMEVFSVEAVYEPTTEWLEDA